jgi:hypothetical protein
VGATAKHGGNSMQALLTGSRIKALREAVIKRRERVSPH